MALQEAEDRHGSETAASPDTAPDSGNAPPVKPRSRPGVVAAAVYEHGQRIRDIEIKDAHMWKGRDKAVVWIGLHEPDDALLREVQAEFGLHELAIEDAGHAHQRPKLEIYEDSMFVVLRTARLCEGGERRIEFGETHVFVGPRYVVTVRHGSLTSHVGLRTRCEASPQLLAKGEGFVLHALMDFIVDQYFPILDALET